MCTVTYIPSGKNIFLSSNRDERPGRKIAFPPACHSINGIKLYFPRDRDAGGTWIAVKESGDAAVLLNGAFIDHDPEPPYKQSRGLVFLDLLAQPNASLAFSRKDLSDIEPFTFILLEGKMLKEFRWDGTEKYYKDKQPDVPHLWCSSTIYDGMETRKRVKRLHDFLKENPYPEHNEVISLHEGTASYEKGNFLVPGDSGNFNTVSITSIQINHKSGLLAYRDLIQQEQSQIRIPFNRISEVPK